MKNIPFSPPYIDASVEAEVLDALRSGWITSGPKVKELEAKISALCGVEHSVCVNSWTSGMMLVLHWFGVKPGDEVIIPAYTYAATGLVVLHLGAKPVMVDVGEDFNLNPESLAEAITPKTKAIMPVDFAGWPCDYEKIYQVVESKRNSFQPNGQQQEILGRPLITADAAHSIGATYRNKPSGSLADISVFSLHAVKNITSAEGGAITLNMPAGFKNEAIAETFKLWSLNGQTKDAFSKSKGGNWRYDIIYPGFKINMPDVSAAIALAQIRIYKERLLVERKRVFDQYQYWFSNEDWAAVPKARVEGTETSYHLFALRLKGEAIKLRDKIIAEAAEAGISLNVHFIPLPQLSVFKAKGYQTADYPQAQANFEAEISLPIYPEITNEDCARIFKQIKKTIES